MAADTNTRVVAVRLDESVAERLERIAEADQRSVGNLLRLVIVRALPSLESEVLGTTAPAKAEVEG